MCGKEYNQIDKQTDQLESQSWAVIGITITNVVAVIIQGLLRCKKQATSKEREEEEENRHKVYHYVSKWTQCERARGERTHPFLIFDFRKAEWGEERGRERGKIAQKGNPDVTIV